MAGPFCRAVSDRLASPSWMPERSFQVAIVLTCMVSALEQHSMTRTCKEKVDARRLAALGDAISM